MPTGFRLLPIAAGTLGLVAILSGQPVEFDLLLRNARVVDGTGSPWYRADVAITGDTITRIASSIDGGARRVIDVQGRVVAA